MNQSSDVLLSCVAPFCARRTKAAAVRNREACLAMLPSCACITLDRATESEANNAIAVGSSQAQMRYGMRLKHGGMNEPHPDAVHGVWRVKCKCSELSTPHGAHTAIHLSTSLFSPTLEETTHHTELSQLLSAPLCNHGRDCPRVRRRGPGNRWATLPRPIPARQLTRHRSHRMRSFRVTNTPLPLQTGQTY